MYIGIEELAANALIELLRQDSTTRFVRFSTLLDYGVEVVRLLRAEDEKAVLMYSRERNDMLFTDYSCYFESAMEDGWAGVRLKDGITIDDLWIHFRTSLTLRLLEAFMNDVAVNVLKKVAA